jgi:peptidoglycan/LPS O-acetylase OafA/YrhL
MPWYQSVLILGSIAMSLIILIRPSSDGRRMAFTLVLGALVLVTIGLALKEVSSGVSVSAWLAN